MYEKNIKPNSLKQIRAEIVINKRNRNFAFQLFLIFQPFLLLRLSEMQEAYMIIGIGVISILNILIIFNFLNK